MREALVALKAEHPQLHLRELATICYIRFGRRLGHQTVKRVLAETPLPVLPSRRYPAFHAMADPATRRIAIIRLHAEGWNAKGTLVAVDALIKDALQEAEGVEHEILAHHTRGVRQPPREASRLGIQ